MDFQKVKLGTIADITTGKSNVVDSLKDGLYPFYDRSDLVKRSNRYLYDVESAIIMPGESSTFLPKMAYGKFDLHQRAYAIFPHNGIYPEYLYYYILYAHDYFKIVSTGSTVASLRLGMFLDMPIQLPSFDNQQKIASILSALDKKIALNRQINQNLEALARQLYDYWFVQFDFPDANGKPYKSSGGKMVYNPILKREIPEGWEVKEIGAILDKVKSSMKLTTNEFLANGKYPIIDQATDTYYAGFTDREDAVLDQYPAVVFGDHSCAVKYVNFPFVRGADGTQVMISKESRISTEYLYFAVKDVKIGKGYARHYSFLKSSLIIVPSQAVALKFREKADNLLNQITHRREEILSLTKQRDELLPLLMNGQVNFDLSDD